MNKEYTFLLRKKPAWKKLDDLLLLKKRTFQEMHDIGELYLEVTDNLSYAQTHFPDSETVLYLTDLVRQCHLIFHRTKKSRIKAILNYFTGTLPKLIYSMKVAILVSLLLFGGAIIISFIMVNNNAEFAEMFLDSRTYEMVREDLALRKQFGNFDNIPSEARGPLSLFLWFNNSRVAIISFAFGITFGIGTVYVLISNGFMLGALLAVYWMNGHFLDFFSIIMVHGSIELTAIVISGGAGFAIAAAILNPGREKRTDRLKRIGRHALLLVIGVVIFLLWAGLVEGLITPMKLPIVFRLLIASFNFSLLVAYFFLGMFLTRRDRWLQQSALSSVD